MVVIYWSFLIKSTVPVKNYLISKYLKTSERLRFLILLTVEPDHGLTRGEQRVICGTVSKVLQLDVEDSLTTTGTEIALFFLQTLQYLKHIEHLTMYTLIHKIWNVEYLIINKTNYSTTLLKPCLFESCLSTLIKRTFVYFNILSLHIRFFSCIKSGIIEVLV